MKVVSPGSSFEHILFESDSSNSKVLIGSDEIIPEYCCVKVVGNDVQGIVRYYSENELFQNKVLVRATPDDYEAMCALARSEDVGLAVKFHNELCIYPRCSTKDQLELDEKAYSAGFKINLERYARGLAASVPSMLTRNAAEVRISNVFGSAAISVTKLMHKALDALYDEFHETRSLDFGGMSRVFLGHDLSLSEVGFRLRGAANQAFRDGGIHIVMMDMGRGKTKSFIQQVLENSNSSGGKASFLTHRHSILNGNTFDGILKVCTDPEVSGNEDALQGLSLIVNRCTHRRFQAHLSDSDVLVIDEAAQVLRHVANKNFEGDQIAVWERLIELIQKTRLVILADACINDEVLEVIKRSGRKITYISETHTGSERFAEVGTTHQVKHAIAEALQGTAPLLIGVDSRKEAIVQADSALKKGKRVLLITAETVSTEPVRRFFEIPNSEMRSYDVIVYTSAMQSSIGITESYFSHHFFMFFRVIGIDEALQMTARDRTAKNIVVGIEKNYKYVTTAASHWARRICTGVQTFDSFAIKTEQKLAREFNNFPQWFSMNMERSGIAVTNMITDATNLLLRQQQEKKEAEAQVNAHVEDILIQLSKFPDEKAVDLKTVHNQDLTDFFAITKLSPSSLVEEDVRFILKRNWRSMLNNAASHFLTDQEFLPYMLKVIRQEWGSKKYVFERRKCINSAMKCLVPDDESRIITEAAVNEAAALIRSNSYGFHALELVSIVPKNETPRANHALVTNFLNSLGLSKKRTTENNYFIDKKKLQQMRRYCHAWLAEERDDTTMMLASTV
ncbi:DEAD/DEAH box helicase family protein [Pseudomonas sp. NPDC088368]|uniref:DEAD/DEAH box helicase family protein n=1 Tax=Pseudomonas sp. NPDC088368 TaxID=3364453 RepID=UPI00382819E3